MCIREKLRKSNLYKRELKKEQCIEKGIGERAIYRKDN